MDLNEQLALTRKAAEATAHALNSLAEIYPSSHPLIVALDIASDKAQAAHTILYQAAMSERDA